MVTVEYTYVVQPGDTLFLIAKKFNTSLDAIMKRNDIVNPSLIYPGQTLIVPISGTYYTVKPDDTLYLIGQKLGVPYEPIIYVNNIVYPYTIYPGQVLFIPGAADISTAVPPINQVQQAQQVNCPFYYVISNGDTLWDIANRFGISLDALVKANYFLNPNLIYPGQTIIIPCPDTPPIQYPILKRGDAGPFVTNLQSRLKSLGFYNGSIDGIFGPITESAVKAYQTSIGLSPTGIVDSNTWNALLYNTPVKTTNDMKESENTIEEIQRNGFNYIVQPSDTIWLISNKFNISVDSILKANPQIADPSLIYPGQNILIPNVETPIPPHAKVYIVKPGDTIWLISNKFNIPVDIILKANPNITNPALIYPGQKILIPIMETHDKETDIKKDESEIKEEDISQKDDKNKLDKQDVSNPKEDENNKEEDKK